MVEPKAYSVSAIHKNINSIDQTRMKEMTFQINIRHKRRVSVIIVGGRRLFITQKIQNYLLVRNLSFELSFNSGNE